MSFRNLTIVAATDYNNQTREGGKGIVAGSKIPHSNIHFDLGSGDVSYNIDDMWTNSRAGKVTLEKGIHNLRIKKHELRNLLVAWNGSRSIFDVLAEEYVLDGTNPANWRRPGMGDGDNIQIQLADGLALNSQYTRRAVLHLLSMSAGIFWRERTISLLSGNVRYKEKVNNGQPADKTVAVNWASVTAQVRGVVRDKLRRHQDPPKNDDHLDVPPSNPAVGPSYDAAIAEILEQEAGFRWLFEKGLIKKAHGQYDPASAATWVRDPALQTTKRQLVSTDDVIQPLNHIRFIMYMEWRGVREIQKVLND
ncbi:hypothetical protein WME75_33210 [Sorangium sp. So ce1014]|uniref:hypothetical protein n=1 Tax=Sorangium sp. So ce1014 TaxID=3133326 RepID=UPI003F5D9943